MSASNYENSYQNVEHREIVSDSFNFFEDIKSKLFLRPKKYMHGTYVIWQIGLTKKYIGLVTSLELIKCLKQIK